MPKINYITNDKSVVTIDAEVGSTVMLNGQDPRVGILGTCGGCMQCATCHVIVAPEWFEKCGERSPGEQVLLEIDPSATATSRLGCQIKVTDQLDGLTVKLPEFD